MGLDYPPGCNDMGPQVKYDPAMAKRLLAEAGYPNGFPLDLIGSPTLIDQTQLDVAQQYWKDVGIKANLKLIDIATFYGLLASKSFDGIMAGASVGRGTDLDAFAWRVHSTGPENWSGINDPQLDSFVAAQRGEFDIVKRRALGREMAQRLWDQAWLLNVADSYYAEWSQLYLRNWASHELYYLIDRQGAFAIEHVWLDK